MVPHVGDTAPGAPHDFPFCHPLYDAWVVTASQPLSRTERAQLCALFDEVGPDSPTLCHGWAARDLAAHLAVRERRPDTASAIVLPKIPLLTRRLESAQAGFAARPWEQLVELVRSGPPGWSPLGLPFIEAAANSSEFFVHHEDVRRASPGWAPRELPAAASETLWRVLRTHARMFYRKAPAGVVLRRPDGVSWRARGGGRMVTLTGEPQELVLHAMGRTSVARVQVSGDPEDVADFSTTPLGV